jgi:DNA polymerase-3 subunit alpha
VFSKAFADCELQIKSDEPLLVTGTVTLDGEDDKEQQAKLRVTSVEYLSEARRKQTQRVELHLHAQDMDDQKLKLFRELLRKHEGITPVVMLITQEGQSRTRLELPSHFRVTPNDGFIRATEGLFGNKAVALH